MPRAKFFVIMQVVTKSLYKGDPTMNIYDITIVGATTITAEATQ